MVGPIFNLFYLDVPISILNTFCQPFFLIIKTSRVTKILAYLKTRKNSSRKGKKLMIFFWNWLTLIALY